MSDGCGSGINNGSGGSATQVSKGGMGNNGGDGLGFNVGAGGGGASGRGGDNSPSGPGAGGLGLESSITGEPVCYAAGGAGGKGSDAPSNSADGTGSGGDGSGNGGEVSKSASLFVDECSIETDMQLLFPATFVPNGSERIMLYRELDDMENDTQIAAYRTRLEDRFGSIPHEAEELIRLVSLRLIAKDLGVERIFLKGGKMSLFFVSDPKSAYYDSPVFGAIISYALSHPESCLMREQGSKRSMLVNNIEDVSSGVEVLRQLLRS